jgi:flavin reductase (DIM6/NTAB) family NADH-FMN oxidoreductase RutF
MSEPDRKGQAAALGRVASGVFVVTVRQGERESGMLASWVQQCSFEPPQITLAVNRKREINGWLTEGTVFTLNILEDGQTELVAHFGRGFAPGEPAFTGLEITRPAGVPPVLSEALAYLVCRIVQRWPVGDHDLIVGEVTAGQVLDEGHPMVHLRKSGMHY